MSEEAVNIIPKDILGVPLEVGDCVAIAGSTRGALIVGNISKIAVDTYWKLPIVRIVTQAGRVTTRSPDRVAFISRNPSA